MRQSLVIKELLYFTSRMSDPHVMISIISDLHFMISIISDLHFMISIISDLHFMISIISDLHFMISIISDLNFMISIISDLHFKCVISHHIFTYSNFVCVVCISVSRLWGGCDVAVRPWVHHFFSCKTISNLVNSQSTFMISRLKTNARNMLRIRLETTLWNGNLFNDSWNSASMYLRWINERSCYFDWNIKRILFRENMNHSSRGRCTYVRCETWKHTFLFHSLQLE